MYNLVYISGSRSDFSLLKRTLSKLNKHTNLVIIATSMHLSPRFGNTVCEIEDEGFDVRKVDMLLDNDNLASMSKSLGIGLYGITQVVEEIDPDAILLEGDRGETLAGAIAASHLNIPIIHHGGGDITGSIDNKIRYAISMFSDYHLTGNHFSYKNLHSMGIDKEKIYLVGEPGIDDIFLNDFTSENELLSKYEIDPQEYLILLLQHPDTKQFHNTEKNILATLDALKELEYRTIAIHSNSDSGGKVINQKIEEYSKKFDFISDYHHINRKDFLGLMNMSSVIVGNSSSGIVEAPSFKKPFVYIGSRQKNRIKTKNTINVDYNKDEIIKAINFSINDNEFKREIGCIKNPYGDGKASDNITNIILEILKIEHDRNENN